MEPWQKDPSQSDNTKINKEIVHAQTKKSKPTRFHVVFGGTFNPIHLGHEQIIDHLHKKFPDAIIHIMPNYKSPSKQLSTSAELRLEMLLAALENFDGVKLDQKPCTGCQPGIYLNEMETTESSPSYTIKTVRELSRQFPGDKIAWVIGMDTINNMHKWPDWESLLSFCHLYVIQRQGESLKLQSTMRDYIKEKMNKIHEASSKQSKKQNTTGSKSLRIEITEVDAVCGGVFYDKELMPNKVSSSSIRQAIKSNQSLNDKLNPSVHEIIKRESLYK